MEIKQVIQQLGLTEKETIIYLSLLKLGKSTVVAIARDSGIKRTTVHEVLNCLKNQGLVYIGFEGAKRVWFAQPPEKLQKLMETRSKNLEMVLPQLQEIYSRPSTKPHLTYFDGLEGIKNAYSLLVPEFEKDQNYYIISSSSDWFSIDENFFQDFVKKRTKAGIKALMLCPKNSTNIKYSKTIPTKFLPEKIKFTTNVVVYKNKIVFSSVKEKFAFIVESEQFSYQQKQMFELMWELLPQNS